MVTTMMQHLAFQRSRNTTLVTRVLMCLCHLHSLVGFQLHNNDPGELFNMFMSTKQLLHVYHSRTQTPCLFKGFFFKLPSPCLG